MRSVQQLLRTLAVLAGVARPQELAGQLVLLIEGAITLRHVAGTCDVAAIGSRVAGMLLEKHLPTAGCAVDDIAVADVLPPPQATTGPGPR